MVRSLVVGNGNLFVSMDSFLQVREFTYPYAGLENHCLGEKHRIGVYDKDSFSWLENPDWKITQNYLQDTLVTNSIAENKTMQITLNFQDCVDCEENIFLRKIKIKNNSNQKKEIKLFFHQDFHILQHGIGDTAVYDPKKHAIIHYKRNRYFLVNAVKSENCQKKETGDICEFSIGQTETNHFEGTFKDAEDGHLERNPIAQGNVDSTIAIKFEIEAGNESEMIYWICAGFDFKEVAISNKKILSSNPEHFFKNTQMCWTGFSNAHSIDIKKLNKPIQNQFTKSILIQRTHINSNGALIAACDSENLRFNSDTYSYMWPRDAALSYIPYCKLGYFELVKPFFELCTKLLAKPGCLLHKYHPDGTLGSSWHAWQSSKGEYEIPIQEDETALVLVTLKEYYIQSKDKEFLKKMQKPLIKKTADFLVNFRDKNGLPLPSHDLWEERKGIFSYTCATVYAGLNAAAYLMKELNGEYKKYEKAAKEVKNAIKTHLFDEKENRFLRGLIETDNGLEKDYTVDSSTIFLSLLEVFEKDDVRIVSTVENIKEKLWINEKFPGLARYENDYYHRLSNSIPGNPWLICTMWLTLHEIRDSTKESKEKAISCLENMCKISQESGLMPEQFNPFTGEAISMSPLVWSHSTFLYLCLKLLE